MNMTSLCIVIPCKYSEEHGYMVFNCVASIKRTYPEAKVYVVDSDSDDTTYLDKLESDYSVVGLRVKNKNYSTGALWKVYDLTKGKYDNYLLLHDSTMFKTGDCVDDKIDGLLLKKYKVAPITYYTKWQWPTSSAGHRSSKWPKKVLGQNSMNTDCGFVSLLGPMFMVESGVLEEIKQTKFYNIRPSNKYQSECMERLWGFIFSDLGYAKNLEQNSLLAPNISATKNKAMIKDLRKDDFFHKCKTHITTETDSIQKFWISRK